MSDPWLGSGRASATPQRADQRVSSRRLSGRASPPCAAAASLETNVAALPDQSASNKPSISIALAMQRNFCAPQAEIVRRARPDAPVRDVELSQADARGWGSKAHQRRPCLLPTRVVGTPSANKSPADGSDPDPVLSQVIAACPVFPKGVQTAPTKEFESPPPAIRFE